MLRFKVENLGKVASADIQLSPLVILVGRNNTGKSYVATLIWALFNLRTLLNSPAAVDRRPNWFRAFMSPNGQASGKLVFDEDCAGDVLAHLQHELAASGPAFLNEVFAFDGFSTTSITIEDTEPFAPLTITRNESAIEDRAVLPTTSIIFEGVGRERWVTKSSGSTERFRLQSASNRVYLELVYRALLGKHSRRRQVAYIPAARTGLMLSLRALLAQQFIAEEEQTAVQFSRPLAEFLGRLTLGQPSFPRPFTSVADWLSREVLHGDILSTNEEVPVYTYRPHLVDMDIPLHAASSMVTELAPFIVSLRSYSPEATLIFEEPEAHLHISAQRAVARAIARLLNLGARIVVTTHSDTFLQQLNNLMRIYTHPRRAVVLRNLGYDTSELIDPDRVRAYEFLESDGAGTSVQALPYENDGFAVKSLNDTLVSLADETVFIDHDDDDVEYPEDQLEADEQSADPVEDSEEQEESGAREIEE